MMAFIVSRLDEETLVMVECETTGAFSKSDLEIKPDPERAIFNSVESIARIARTFSAGIVPNLREIRANSFELNFACKVDGNGSVMVSQRSDDGQFRITLRWAPSPAGPPRPTA
jgi:hypothetical protein